MFRLFRPDVGIIPKSVTTKPEEMEVVTTVYRLEEARDTAMADIEFTSVKGMVEDWDRKFALEEQVEIINKEEGAKMDRRTSDRFRSLTMCFEKSEEGVRGSEGAEISRSKFEVTDKPTYPTTISNFSDVCSKFDIISRPRKQKLCVVRREGSSLARISTNEKRVRDGECESYLPVSLNWKKRKVSPMGRDKLRD